MIQTVTGPVARAEGRILMHEHIACVSNDMLHIFGSRWLSRSELIERAAGVLTELKSQYGVGMIVDGTPIDLGRDVGVLRAVSEKSGVRIVASTGLYNFPAMITGRSEEEIASWFLAEVRNGCEGTDIHPGILKCACDSFGISEENARRIRALALVQKQTGLPLYVHCTHRGDTVSRVLQILAETGADLHKTVIGHLAIRAEYAYIKDILSYGCYISMDQCHCYDSQRAQLAETLVQLCANGFGDRILLSNDGSVYSDFCPKQYSWVIGSDVPKVFGYIFESLYPEFIARGGAASDWEAMLHDNPTALFARI